MSKGKIGEDVRSKMEEDGAYYAIGIAKLEEGGFGIIKLKVSGTEVLSRNVLKKAKDFAEAIHEYRLESGKFGIEYLDRNIK
jgi:hypothetical protein